MRECDDQKGKLPNNANHFLSFLALTNIIAMALQHLEEAGLAFDNYKSFPSAEKQKLMVGEWKVYWGMENWQSATKINGQPQFCQGQALHLVFIRVEGIHLYISPLPLHTQKLGKAVLEINFYLSNFQSLLYQDQSFPK